MKLQQFILSIIFLLMINFSGFAQKKTFDIVSYTVPKGWTEKQAEGNISYSRIDGDSWAQIAIYQHRNSEGDIQTDFDKDWNELVANGRNISSPEKTEPQTAEGFTVMSGSGVWQYNGANVASMLTVYSNQKICIAILCNSTAMPYLKEYKTLLGSLDLDAASVTVTPATENTDSIAAGANTSMNTGNTSITGLWITYRGEDAGYMNGFRMTTGGYFRKEYLLKEDGTYIFRVKNWSAHMENIYFVYETGTYTVNENQLTITPKQGKAGWWKKEGSRTDKWGSYLKAADYKLETVTYPFYTQQQESRNDMLLILTNTSPVKRDGTIDINDNQTKKWVYGWGGTKSLIDNPPGFKTDVENKTTIAQPENSSNANNNTAIAGTWSQSSSSNPFGQSLSGGYTTMQYTFNNNGTYEYVSKTFSQNMSYIILSKESGKYNIAGNKLTITPTEGSTKSFTKKAGAADQPDKLIKTEKRPLEKTVYTFTSYYFSGIKETNLVLQNDKETFRDGKHSTNTLFPDAWYYKPVSANNPKIELP